MMQEYRPDSFGKREVSSRGAGPAEAASALESLVAGDEMQEEVEKTTRATTSLGVRFPHRWSFHGS